MSHLRQEYPNGSPNKAVHALWLRPCGVGYPVSAGRPTLHRPNRVDSLWNEVWMIEKGEV